MYKTKRMEYKCGYDFNIMSEDIERAITVGTQAVKCVLDGNIDTEIFGREFLQK